VESRSSDVRRERAADIPSPSVQGEFVELDGEAYYKISAIDRLKPFMMIVPGDTDLWMFITSNGGVTAGRVDADGSLFPYITVDRLNEAHRHTGPVTLIRVESDSGASQIWEPFAERIEGRSSVERSLYKNIVGNQLVFEEQHRELGLVFRYRWAATDDFGWVRTATILNRKDQDIRLSVMDGLRNVLPFGVPLSLYQQSSNLVDAYKKSEVDVATGLAIYSLTAQITDRAEAAEVLRANTVWSAAPQLPGVYLSASSLSAFRSGRVLPESRELRGSRGNYILSGTMTLEASNRSVWHVVADAGRDHAAISTLLRTLREGEDLSSRLEASIRKTRENLRRNVASADGLQLTGRPESCAHHFSNVLYNNMRGGVFLSNYELPLQDFLRFLEMRDRRVLDRARDRLVLLGETVTSGTLLDLAREGDDPDFERLCYEYLPLHFGRRHGDPSRPWNRFSIQARNERGEPELNYEGNWRDIFQNWEALATAFPRFLPHMVAKFVNASTVDGFNPYRVSRDGVDWEVVTPDDPWSNIGYWGDHQIAYLLRLLEMWDRHDPQALADWLGREIFSYADVPYRIHPYEELVRDPRSTIDFDMRRADAAADRVERFGTDGKLVADADGRIYHAGLLEKLLVPALAKLSNWIPDGGIWMNTQRPEWNDANNALGGGGVSVVTLGYLRRYLDFLAGRLESTDGAQVQISSEVCEWFERIESVVEEEQALLSRTSMEPDDRKRVLDALGSAFSAYRDVVYTSGFRAKQPISVDRVRQFCGRAVRLMEWGIAANRRDDGLFHTYNLAEFSKDERSLEIHRLPEMLEGQVAVLSSGALGPRQSLEVLDALYRSELYRPDQQSFVLYPVRELPGFMERNIVPDEAVGKIELLGQLLAAGNTELISRDADSILRFNGDFHNADDVAIALDRLATDQQWTGVVSRDRSAVLSLFEDVFRHSEYTGRSGVMYAFEGIGSVYWHMVGKLLLATQEHALEAAQESADDELCQRLGDYYRRIRSGLGYQRSVADYGAFPIDSYSHTPLDGGARQPGMTGQVKEEILTRRGELGIRIQNAEIRFHPTLLSKDEFLRQAESFGYYDIDGRPQTAMVTTSSLAFTLCQVPVIYELGAGRPRIRLQFADGSQVECRGDRLDSKISGELFSRSGRIEQILVTVEASQLASGSGGGR